MWEPHKHTVQLPNEILINVLILMHCVHIFFILLISLSLCFIAFGTLVKYAAWKSWRVHKSFWKTRQKHTFWQEEAGYRPFFLLKNKPCRKEMYFFFGKNSSRLMVFGFTKWFITSSWKKCYFFLMDMRRYCTLYQKYPYRLNFFIDIAIGWH